MSTIETPFTGTGGFTGAILEGTMTATVWEASPVLVTNIVRTDQTWGVKLDWEMKGILTSPLMGLGGDYHLTIYLEDMGPGSNRALPSAGPVKVDSLGGTFDPIALTRTFSENLTFDPAVEPVPAGIYRLTALIQLYHKDPPLGSGAPYPVAGFVEGPVIQFYVP